MIYAPYGNVWAGSVVDPERILDEWYHAKRLAQRTSQYQWQEGAITSVNSIERGESIAIGLAQETYNFGVTSASWEPNATGGWDIPYNSGYATVDGSEVTWTSQFPELVFCVFNWQYYRKSAQDFADNAGYKIRVKLKLSIDGIHQPGSGPYAVPIDTNHRGEGFGAQAGRFASKAMVMVPAGTHTVCAVACQAIGTESDEDADAEGSSVSDGPGADDPTADRVVIGNRKMIVIRGANALWLGS